MPPHPIVSTKEVAQKFLALVERSRANFSDLYHSGRWRYYYSEEELIARARELVDLHDKWVAVAALGDNGLPSLHRWMTELLDEATTSSPGAAPLLRDAGRAAAPPALFVRMGTGSPGGSPNGGAVDTTRDEAPRRALGGRRR
jgi:hypothetical protein